MGYMPYLKTNIADTNRAFRIALGDLAGNIIPFKDGLLKEEKEVIIAGMDYVTPWTRDAAINTWNGAGLLYPEVTKNTLLSVIEERDGMKRVGGEYWDAIIWTLGAWWQYLFTGDTQFLKLAHEAAGNSLRFFEETEFTQQLNLFRGAACYGDGVSAYPEIYVTKKKNPGIKSWATANPEQAARRGEGFPAHVVSTNCLYYLAYEIMGSMEKELGLPENPDWAKKAENLKNAINKVLWNETAGRYDYFVDPFGGCDYQEGLGQSFAILFGVADREQAESIFRNIHIEPVGIPCVWPTFPRYRTQDGSGFGRHSGTVWPHVQGFWAQAAAMYGKKKLFGSELARLAGLASRDSFFAEVYHPVTGAIYGGLQEAEEAGIIEWKSSVRQTWSATAFIRMIFFGLIGMEFGTDGICFYPVIPEEYHEVCLTGLKYRNMVMDIEIRGNGSVIREFKVNGAGRAVHKLSGEETGSVKVEIVISDI